MKLVLQISLASLCIAATILCLVLAYESRLEGQKINELTSTLQTTANSVKVWADDQIEQLRSPQSQKAIEHSLHIGEAGLLTIQKINRTTIPQLNSMLLEGTTTIAAIKQPLAKIDALVNNLDTEVNSKLIPEITARVKDLGATNDEVIKAIKTANLTVADLDNIATNKDIPAIISSLKTTSENIEATTANIEGVSDSANEGMKQFPALMTSFQKYASASTKYQKYLYLAMILRQLAAIPLRLP